MKKNMTKHYPKRLLGVFAHPDDESFCAGGTFARSVAHGAEVMVVSPTRGEAGQICRAGTATRRTLACVREQELQRACQRLGIQHARCLDYADGTLKDIDQQVLIRDVVELLRRFRPDVVDGSLIPGSTGCVNPSLTIAALAERIMDQLLRDN
jgi:LmbE family N-acetylglucosaminyl deacetylase